jgi:hypothetical protein
MPAISRYKSPETPRELDGTPDPMSQPLPEGPRRVPTFAHAPLVLTYKIRFCVSRYRSPSAPVALDGIPFPVRNLEASPATDGAPPPGLAHALRAKAIQMTGRRKKHSAFLMMISFLKTPLAASAKVHVWIWIYVLSGLRSGSAVKSGQNARGCMGVYRQARVHHSNSQFEPLRIEQAMMSAWGCEGSAV